MMHPPLKLKPQPPKNSYFVTHEGRNENIYADRVEVSGDYVLFYCAGEISHIFYKVHVMRRASPDEKK